MVTIIYILIAFAFVALAGMFDGAQTARKDLYNDTPLYDWSLRHGWERWYIGGNAEFNPSLPSIPWFGWWSGDFWHSAKFGWIYSWSIAMACTSLASLTVWQAALVALVAQAIEGRVFILFYHNIFVNEPKESLWKLTKQIFPWVNTSKRQS